MVNQYLKKNGLKVNRGTIVDASIINAPSSTKNKKKQRDQEMHQTRKGNQWYFGMKSDIGVDGKTKPIHSVMAIPTHVHDSVILGDLLHGDESRVWGDSAYTGKRDVIVNHAPRAKNFTNKKGSRYVTLSEIDRSKNRNKPKVRSKIEHAFGVMKGRFGFTKVRYKRVGEERPSFICILCISEPGHGKEDSFTT